MKVEEDDDDDGDVGGGAPGRAGLDGGASLSSPGRAAGVAAAASWLPIPISVMTQS